MQSKGVCSLSPSTIKEKVRVREASSLPGGDSVSLFVIHKNDVIKPTSEFPKEAYTHFIPAFSKQTLGRGKLPSRLKPLPCDKSRQLRSVTRGSGEPPKAKPWRCRGGACSLREPRSAQFHASLILRLTASDAVHPLGFVCTVGAGFLFLPLNQG